MPRPLPALLALLLAGCQLAPPHQRPASPVPAGYPHADTAIAPQAVDIDWQRFFADPRLRALLEQAFARNRDLRVAVARIEEARGLYRVQRAARLPGLDLDASASRGRYPMGTGGAAGGGAAGVDTSGVDTSGAGASGAGAGVVERYSLGVGVSAFELDFWGRVRNLGEAARAQYLASVQAQRAFRLSLIGDLSATYLALREAEQRVALADATVERRRQGVEIARVRFEAGITSALDYHQAESLLTQAQTERAALRLTLAEQRHYLALLAGGEPERPLPAPRALHEQVGAGTLAAGLPAQLLYRRPDILAAEERLRAARADIGVARAAFFPRISLTGSAGYLSTELGDLVGRDSRTWSIGPALNLPLFDWGGRRGDLSAAQAREHVAVAEYERAIETAFREVADALAGRRFLAERLEAQQRNRDTLRRLAEIARDRYAEGVVNYLEVLDAERNLFEAEQAWIAAQRAQAQNLVTLYLALGGGLEPPGADAP